MSLIKRFLRSQLQCYYFSSSRSSFTNNIDFPEKLKIRIDSTFPIKILKNTTLQKGTIFNSQVEIFEIKAKHKNLFFILTFIKYVYVLQKKMGLLKSF